MKKVIITCAFALLLLSAGAQDTKMQFPDSLRNEWAKIYNLNEDDDINKCIKEKAKKCEESWVCYVYCSLNFPFCLGKWTAECLLNK